MNTTSIMYNLGLFKVSTIKIVAKIWCILHKYFKVKNVCFIHKNLCFIHRK